MPTGILTPRAATALVFGAPCLAMFATTLGCGRDERAEGRPAEPPAKMAVAHPTPQGNRTRGAPPSNFEAEACGGLNFTFAPGYIRLSRGVGVGFDATATLENATGRAPSKTKL
jgi:hypothetical protein